MSDDRDMGVDFGDLTAALESEEYPMSQDELLEKYGDRRLEHASGSDSLREILRPLDDREFRGADDVHQAVLNMIGEEAVGREEYSDRGAGTAPDEGDSESL